MTDKIFEKLYKRGGVRKFSLKYSSEGRTAGASLPGQLYHVLKTVSQQKKHHKEILQVHFHSPQSMRNMILDSAHGYIEQG